jgi:protocatechuate 3,4-dioxygenase beta subunit
MNESLDRRRALTLLGGAGLAALVGCSSSAKSTAAGASSSAGTRSSSGSSTSSASSTSSDPIPEETEGPFPGDGSNGPNALTQDGVVRQDITKSFGSMSGTADGVPTTIELTITDTSKGGAPFAGAAVYVWHCTREGDYSLYSQGASDQNFLRGVQEADADGKVTFTTIFPGAYPGRWPHVHYEVYPTLDAATNAKNKVATSQLALPEDTCNSVYETTGYEASVTNMQRLSLSSDMVFQDGAERETPTASGDPNRGITLRLDVPV